MLISSSLKPLVISSIITSSLSFSYKILVCGVGYKKSVVNVLVRDGFIIRAITFGKINLYPRIIVRGLLTVLVPLFLLIALILTLSQPSPIFCADNKILNGICVPTRNASCVVAPAPASYSLKNSPLKNV